MLGSDSATIVNDGDFEVGVVFGTRDTNYTALGSES